MAAIIPTDTGAFPPAVIASGRLKCYFLSALALFLSEKTRVCIPI